MKKFLPLIAFFASTAFAGDFYMGSQIGIAKDGLSSSNNFVPPITALKETNSQIAGRIAVGHDFNRYFALETGYLMTTNTHVTNGLNNKEHFKISEQIADLTGVATWYMGDSFYLYGKTGLAYINAKTGEQTKDNINFLYGAAIGYNIAPNVSVDVSWTRYNGSRDTASDIKSGKFKPDLDFYALGLTYRF